MPRISLRKIVEIFEKGGLKERESAAMALSKLADAGLGIEQGKFALKAAARKYPPRKYHFYDSSRDLVSAAAKCPRPEYIPIILELYPAYNEQAKVESLRLLSEMEECEAAVAYMQIVNSFAREGSVPRLVTNNFELKPRHPDVFFPNLLNYARIHSFEHSVYYMFLCYLQKSLIKTDGFSRCLGSIVSSYKKYEKKLMPAQQSSGAAWMWKDRYQEWRSKASLLLDILGHFPASGADEPLLSALAYRDPRLKLFGVTSLMAWRDRLVLL